MLSSQSTAIEAETKGCRETFYLIINYSIKNWLLFGFSCTKKYEDISGHLIEFLCT